MTLIWQLFPCRQPRSDWIVMHPTRTRLTTSERSAFKGQQPE